MEPKNTSERSKALRNFLIFFIITIALIAAAVFFSIQVPFKENEQLTKQMEVVNNERAFSEKFESNINDVMRLFDTLNIKGANIDLIDGKISEKLQSLTAMIDSDSSFASDPSAGTIKELYTTMVTNMSNFRNAKKEVREATSNETTLGDYKQQVQSLKAELNMKDQQINTYMFQLQMMSKGNN